MKTGEEILAEYKCSVSYEKSGKKVIDSEKCTASIYSDHLSLSCGEKTAVVDYTELSKLEKNDYRVILESDEVSSAEVYALGLQYENFCRDLTAAYKKCLKTYLLMDEKPTGFEAQCKVESTVNGVFVESRADVLFFENGVAVLPDQGMPFRVPFAAVENADEADYSIKLVTSDEESVIFSMLGRSYDPFIREMNSVNDMIIARSAEQLSFLKGSIPQAAFSQLCNLMKDGKGAERSNLDRINKSVFPAIIENLSKNDKFGKIDLLLKIADAGEMLVGVKRGLLGSLSGGYIWMLAPVKSAASKHVHIILETFREAGEEGGMATYVFSVPEEKYDGSRTMHGINGALMAVNFRREPIYMSDGQLAGGGNRGYRYAVRNLRPLKYLRSCFSERIMPKGPKEWTEAVYRAVSIKKEI